MGGAFLYHCRPHTLGQSLNASQSSQTWLAGPAILRQGLLSPNTRIMALWACLNDIYTDSGDPKLGLHACWTSTLPMEPSISLVPDI